ncbi:hypothetical protein D3C81_1763060 [compost metagenome]
MTESGVVTGQNEVAHQRQFTTTAKGKTVDGGNDRLAPVGHTIAVAEQIVHVDLRVSQLGHFLDVGTGGKSLFRTGDDDATDIRIRFQCIKGLVHFADQLRVQRIQRLWAVESDQANAAMGFQQNGFVRHESKFLLKDCAK